MRNFCLSLLLLITSISAGTAFGQSKTDWVPGQLLVQSTLNANPNDVSRTLRTHGASVQGEIPQIKVHVLRVPDPALEHVKKALESTGLFTFVERDFIARPASTPNDPSFVSEWHLLKIQAPAAWDLTLGSASTPIAIVDSGADPTHSDLKPKLLAGWSWVLGSSNTSDGNGHGTIVSGAAAAATNNAIGVAGVGWNNPIMPLAVLRSDGSAYYSDMASAITYAADHGVRVISMSLASSMGSSALQSAVDYAWNKGSVLFAAAANYNTSTPYYPAAYNNAVAVAATTSSDTKSSYSNYGNWIDLSAPGDSILTTYNGGGFGYASGTSLATPVAAGVAALVLSIKPSLSASGLVGVLEQSADDLGTAGFDQYFGWGRVNALRAVSAALITVGDSTRPVVAISSPLPGATVSGTISVQGTATDNVGVTRTEFYVDNLLASSGNTPFSFSWNTAGVANGTHTLKIKAYDAASNVGESSVSVNVNNVVVADTTPPSVLITSPTNGSYVGNKNVKITVAASDNRSVTQVSVFVDGTLASTLITAPYTYNWTTRKIAPGSHIITSKAWDAAGNMGSAAAVTVTKQ